MQGRVFWNASAHVILCVVISKFTALSAMFDSQNQPSVDSYIPQRVLTSSVSLRQRSDRPPWCKYRCNFTCFLCTACYKSHKLLMYPDVCVYFSIQTAVVLPVQCLAPVPHLPPRQTPPHASALVRKSPSPLRAVRKSIRPCTTPTSVCPPHLHKASTLRKQIP